MSIALEMKVKKYENHLVDLVMNLTYVSPNGIKHLLGKSSTLRNISKIILKSVSKKCAVLSAFMREHKVCVVR